MCVCVCLSVCLCEREGVYASFTIPMFQKCFDSEDCSSNVFPRFLTCQSISNFMYLYFCLQFLGCTEL